MSYVDQSEDSKALNQREHNRDASAKRIVLRAQDPTTGSWFNIRAVANSGGTYSLATKILGDSDVFDGGSTNNEVSITEQGELMTATAGEKLNVYARYAVTNIGATSYAILVDKSDTTNWKHATTGQLNISYVGLLVDRDATGAGDLRLGVITRVNGTDADVVYFTSIIFTKSDVRHLERDENYTPSEIKIRVTNGEWALGAAPKTTGITAINTATPLDSYLGSGTVTPAVGDLVIRFGWTAGSYDASAKVLYHGEA